MFSVKRIGFLLFIVLAMILVVGCGNNDNDNTENQPNNSSTNNNEAANNNENNDEGEILSLGGHGRSWNNYWWLWSDTYSYWNGR